MIRASDEKRREQEEVERKTREFLESGGQIQKIPSGVYTDDMSISSRKRSKQAITV